MYCKSALTEYIKLWDILHLVIVMCYLLTYSVTQNADSVDFTRQNDKCSCRVV